MTTKTDNTSCSTSNTEWSPAPGADAPRFRWWRAVLTLLLLLIALPAGTLASGQDYFDELAKERVRQTTAERDLPYLVELGSRVFLPGPDTPIDFRYGRAVVYLQFHEPLTAVERAQAIRDGVRFFRTVNQFTYLARIGPRTLEALWASGRLRGVEPVVYADRITPGMYSGQLAEQTTLLDDSLVVEVWFYDDVSLAHAVSALRDHDIATRDRPRMLYGNRLIVKGVWEQLMALSERPVVYRIFELPPRSGVTNIGAQILSRVDDVQNPPWSLTGTGVLLGIWDEGPVRDDHPDLLGRVSVVEAGTNNDHATHVAGTMMGNGSNNAIAEGMAPNAQMLYSYDLSGSPTSEMMFAHTDFGIDIANNSWGFILGWNGDTDEGNDDLFGAYFTRAPLWDQLVLDTDLVIVKSAGNDRDDCDPNDASDCDGFAGSDGEQYDTIPERGNAKNVITVGATEDDGDISFFSSSGPANDGRIKPDVVANGVSLLSTWSGGTTINDPSCNGFDYCHISGTSMSTPVVSGISALLVQQYRQRYLGVSPDACTIKAVLVNTAEDRGRLGPDYLYGHGLVDALGAVETIDDGPVRIVNEIMGQGAQDEYVILVPGGTQLLSVTLAWMDPPADVEMLPSETIPDLVNNLDVELISPSSLFSYPWQGPGLGNPAGASLRGGSNLFDNVERVTVENPEQGAWRIRVRGTTVPEGEQEYCLVTSAPLTLGEQPDIVLNAPLNFYELCFNEWQDIDCTIYNTGGAPLYVHDVSVTAGMGDFRVLQPPTPPFVVLPGSHIDVTVRFSPGLPGVKMGTLSIFSNDPDEPFLDVPMTGFGGVQDLKTSLEAFGNFGHVNFGEFRTLEYQIINQGTCPLIVTDLTRQAGSIEFTLGSQTGAPIFPLTLFPGEHVQFFFRYAPTDYTFDAASWLLETDDPDTPTRTFELQGRCLPPDIALSGSTDFGPVCPTEQAETVLNVCNLGRSDLLVFTVELLSSCDDFEFVNSPFGDPPTVISKDFCLPLTIRYTPTTPGDHTCTLRITSNDPDEPIVEVTLRGYTPPPVIDVPDDIGFPPTVVQQVDTFCESVFPFPVTNQDLCELLVVDMAVVPPVGDDPNFDDYTLEGLPDLPIFVQAGHVLGNGAVRIAFRPTAVRRFIRARVAVTYVSHDPGIGDTTTLYVELCGEGVNTGARLLVTQGGTISVLHVEKITLWSIEYYGEPNQTSNLVEVALDKHLQSITENPPCPGFYFHHEWGGETNPIVLEPGWYRVETAVGTLTPPVWSTEFYIPDVCTFLPDVVVDYP